MSLRTNDTASDGARVASTENPKAMSNNPKETANPPGEDICSECGFERQEHAMISDLCPVTIDPTASDYLEWRESKFSPVPPVAEEGKPKCQSCGGLSSTPMRRNNRNDIVCNSCFERWRFIGSDADKNRDEWKIIMEPPANPAVESNAAETSDPLSAAIVAAAASDAPSQDTSGVRSMAKVKSALISSLRVVECDPDPECDPVQLADFLLDQLIQRREASVQGTIDRHNERVFSESEEIESLKGAVLAAHSIGAENMARVQRQLLMALSDVSRLQDQLDMNRDEFLRIKALCANHPDDAFFLEIEGLCDRSQQVITQRVSVIQQRDKAEEKATRLQSELATEKDCYKQMEMAANAFDKEAKEAQTALAASQAEAKALTRSLAKYGRHTDACLVEMGWDVSRGCSCGFLAALSTPTEPALLSADAVNAPSDSHKPSA